MSGVAVNAIVSPWFVRARPAALGTAYNGASFAGLILSPLWVSAIVLLRASRPRPRSSALSTAVVVVGARGALLRAHAAPRWGLRPTATARARRPQPSPRRAHSRCRARRCGAISAFITLAAGAALSLFAQIGLITHLYSLLVPALGKQWAGLVMGIGTGAGMGGRMLVGG